MARVASTSTTVEFARLRPCSLHSHHQSPPQSVSFTVHNRIRRPHRFVCQSTPDPVGSDTTEEKPIVEAEVSNAEPLASSGLVPDLPDRGFNRRIAFGATLVAFGLFLSKRLEFGVSLKDLTAAALPYEEALSNGKPTVVEFYADWCEVCKELAPDVYKVEQKYKGLVNFVLLNVDNTKWEQELDEFGVEGIPHFAFLDRQGNEEGNVVGRLPRQYLLENVDALAQGKTTVPHARVVGQFSRAENRKVRPVTDPRSHG